MSAPLPAPLPSSINNNNNNNNNNNEILSILPPSVILPKIEKNDKKKEKYYIQFKYRSHGKQFIGSYLQQKYNLEEISYDHLPNKLVIFYWLQREYQYDDTTIFDLNTLMDVKPCIAYIPSQGKLCEKAQMAKALYSYHGDYTWTFVPITHHISYDFNTKNWDVSHLQHIFQKKTEKDVWIVKSSLGSLGYEVHLFVGNDIDKLHTLLKEKYIPENWRDLVKDFSKELEVQTVVLQEYISKPLLFKKHYKFDLRMYVLTASTNPTVVFYHPGKMRICGVKYSDDYSEKAKWGHITNCKIQREHENFEYTNQTIDGQEMLSDWEGFIRFIYQLCVDEDYFDIEWYEHKKDKKKEGQLTIEDIDELIAVKSKHLIRDISDSVAKINDEESVKLQRPCQFTFHGIDVMMDERGKMWLLEVNRSASISLVGFENIREMTKRMLAEMVDIVLEIRDIKRSGRRFDQDTPLSSVKVWQKVRLSYLDKELKEDELKNDDPNLNVSNSQKKEEVGKIRSGVARIKAYYETQRKRYQNLLSSRHKSEETEEKKEKINLLEWFTKLEKEEKREIIEISPHLSGEEFYAWVESKLDPTIYELNEQEVNIFCSFIQSLPSLFESAPSHDTKKENQS